MAIFTGIASAIAGALFTSASAIALATNVIAAALSYGAQLALSYLTRQKSPKNAAVQGEVQLGGDVPVSVVYGTARVPGHRMYYAKRGPGNRYNDEVFVLSNGRCAGLEPYVYFYGAKHDLTSVTPVGNEHARYTVDGFASNIVIRFYDGRPGQGVDTELVAATTALDTPWLSTSVLAGHAYVVVTRDYSSELFEKGQPTIDFVLRGLLLWDPRKDSTIPGGSGSHRLNDPATWEHSANPAIIRLNYQIGLKGLLSGDTLLGAGKRVDQIDIAMHMTAANVSDTERTVSGRTVPTYQMSRFVTADEDHLEVLKDIEDAMAGYAVNRSGLDGVLAGAPQVPVLTITNRDIRANEGRRYNNRGRGSSSVNSLSGQFTCIEDGWKPRSLETVYSNTDIAADGAKRAEGNDFLQVTNADIAQYLLTIRYRQNRKRARRVLPVSRNVGCRIRTGDWVSYEGKTWLVTNWSFDTRLLFTIELSETSADIYAEGGIAPGPITPPAETPSNPSLISTVSGFTVASGLVLDASGQNVPALVFGWINPNDPTVQAVRIQYRRQSDPTRIFEVMAFDVASGSLTTTRDALPDEIYDARATIVTTPDRLKTFTSWIATSSVTGRTYVDWNRLSEPVRDWLSEVDGRVASAIQNGAENEWEDVYGKLGTMVQGAKASVEAGDARATIRRETRLLATADEALATDIVALGASLGDKADAAVVTAQGARVTALEGQATALASYDTELTSRVDEASAGALFAMKTEASPGGGVVARLSMFARTAIGGVLRRAGLLIDVTSSDASVSLVADKIKFLDGLGNAFALFTAGGSTIETARIGNLDAGSITTGTLGVGRIADGSLPGLKLQLGSTPRNGGLDLTGLNATGAVAGSFSCANPSGAPVQLSLIGTVRGNLSSGGGAAITRTMVIRRNTGGVFTTILSRGVTVNAGQNAVNAFDLFRMDRTPPAGTSTYEVVITDRNTGLTGTSDIKIDAFWSDR